MKLEDLNINSSEEDIIDFCKQEADGTPGFGVGHEMKLNYGLNLLLIKQQQKLLTDQNNFNINLLKTNKNLVLVTWVLVIVSAISSMFTIYYQKLQTIPIQNALAKEVNENLSLCFQNSDSNLTLSDGSTTTCKMFLRQHKPQLDAQLGMFPSMFASSSSLWITIKNDR